MAELFKATLTGDHGFEKLVAIKKILPHLATDKSFVEMFIDEARITAQLDHRHIVQVFELGTDADTPYIAMQYVDGLDVLALLRECARAQIRLPPDLAALIARDVLDALDYAHNALDATGRALGIIHRDISPGNVLLSWRGDVKLTDFGIARAAERRHKTEAGTLKGKYGYMSPEQVSGGEIDARSRSVLRRHPARRDGDGAPAVHLDERPRHPADGARRAARSPAQVRDGVPGRAPRADRRARCSAGPRIAGRARRSSATRSTSGSGAPRASTSRDLAALLGQVINAPTADLEGDGESSSRTTTARAVGSDDADEPGARRGRGGARRAPSSSPAKAIPTGVSATTARAA